MRKRIILISLLLVVFVFTGTSYADENPFIGLTEDQIIQKYFAGRQLDEIEGIWVEAETRIIVKSSLVGTVKEYKDYDYIMVTFSASPDVEIFGVSKTKMPHLFEFGKGKKKEYFRQISPSTFYWTKKWIDHGPVSLIVTRSYPSDLK